MSVMNRINPFTHDTHALYLHKVPLHLLCGSAHYVRTHPSQWSRLFATFHAAQLNAIETYVFWNHHAPSEDTHPNYDFTGRRDLFGFITAAGRAGLHVVLRLGPYICAESNYGGFPVWLRQIPQLSFRAWNKPFMHYVEQWIAFLSSELKRRKLLACDGGPVILIQLENEYSMVSDQYGDEGAKYLQWCADLQKSQQFNIPAIMCYGAADGVLETINSFYAHEELPDHRRRHPDQPAIWTEMWSGWYDTWGSRHHVRDTKDVAYAVARFFAAGGSGVNYYMWFGGTNFGREGMYCQVGSYDYDAPVDEFGRETTKMKVLTRLHKVLKAVFESGRWDGGDNGVFQWGNFSFQCDDTEKTVRIMDKNGDCVFCSSEIKDEDVVKRRYEAVKCSISPWTYSSEKLPSFDNMPHLCTSSRKFARSTSDKSGICMPPEQLDLTLDSTDYAWYTTRIRGNGRHTIRFQAADVAYVFVDGCNVGESQSPPWEDRWENKWHTFEKERGTDHEMEVALNATHELCVLTVSMGLIKGDWQLKKGCNMKDERKGLLSDVSGVERVGEWRALGGLSMNGSMGELSENSETVENGQPFWKCCKIELERDCETLVLDLSRLGKGCFWVNGTLVGRFWDVQGTRPRSGFLKGSPVTQVAEGMSQRYYHVPMWMIKENGDGDGKVMEVVVFVERGDKEATLDVLRSV